MIIPLLGEVTKDARFESYWSNPLIVPMLGRACRFALELYDEDPAKEDFLVAVKNFLSADRTVLQAAESHIYNYYKDCGSFWETGDEDFPKIMSQKDIWKYAQLGGESIVSRRRKDNTIYISLECNCDWEQEHGLQIVFKNGLKVNKVGPFDGHRTNSDAFSQEDLEGVIYRRLK
jgi:hypothetical protein